MPGVRAFRFYLVNGDRIEHVLCWHQVQSSEELKESLRKVKEVGLIPESDIREQIKVQKTK